MGGPVHRRAGYCLAALCGLIAGNASANYTIDLIWADSGSANLSFDTFTAPTTAAPCSSGLLYDGSPIGRCLIVRLTATAQWTASITTLGWDAASSGLAVDHTGLRSFGLFGGAMSPAAPVFVNVAGTADCAPACDTAIGSFGGLAAAAIAAGVYTMGSINFDTSGIWGGFDKIVNFSRVGVDGTTDKKFANAPVQLNHATIQWVPEPSTASLLGLGVLALCAVAKRRA
jgi:hypothetical protein